MQNGIRHTIKLYQMEHPATSRGARPSPPEAAPDAGAPHPYRVPAVDRAVQVLRYLKRHRNVTVTDIAQALGVGASTCYAILKTLQHHNLVGFDERGKTYSLGLGPVELGGAVKNVIASAAPEANKSTTNLARFLAKRSYCGCLVTIPRYSLVAAMRTAPMINVAKRMCVWTRTAITTFLPITGTSRLPIGIPCYPPPTLPQGS